MPKYMLLCSSSTDFGAMTSEEIRAIAAKYRAWRLNLDAPGEKLCDGSARFLRRRSGKLAISDGPFIETKEMVAGYFTIEADSYDHAVELARNCPHLEFGPIEIRQIEQV